MRSGSPVIRVIRVVEFALCDLFSAPVAALMLGDFQLPARPGGTGVSLAAAAAAAPAASLAMADGLMPTYCDAICFPSLQEYHARLTTG